MAGRDLRALFGSNDHRVGAAEAFTNREDQWRIFVNALEGHLRHVSAAGFDAADLEAPRRNLLVFHGVGGIGKSTLSRRLEAALANAEHRPAQWGEPVWHGPRIVPLRLDLARSANTDFERVVVTIRLAVAAAVGRPMPAFDIALRRYWDHRHPGEPLEEHLRRDGLLTRFGQALPQQMQAALGEVAQGLALPGMLGSAVGQLTGALVRALREHRRSVSALAGCARLADLLEADTDLEALSYYPHLLAWELARLPARKQIAPVVLLDTFEDIGDRTHRDMERLLQHVVWLMPNVFFVVTGRSRLQWADPALHGQLDWTGPVAWPGLAERGLPTPRATPDDPGSRRQILIGNFSDEDRQNYLTHRLTTDGRPLIDPTLRRVIAERSHGLPLYLDLAAMRFLEIRRNGLTPQPADFDGDFPALIARTLTDLTPDERHVLRSVSLLDAFDIPLATATAGISRDAPVLRLLERPFIRHTTTSLWPYHLHALIRSTLRTAEDTTDDRWSPRDWRNAAERAHSAIGRQWAEHTGPGRRLLIACLRQGLALASEFHLDLGWLTEAAWQYVSDSVWEPVTPAPRDTGDEARLQTPADALVELLTALGRRQHEHRRSTATRLAAVVDAGLLPEELGQMALYYLAKAHRDLGHSVASRTGMQQVADGGGRLAPAARRGLAHLARLAGDFPTALTVAQNLGWAGRQNRVLGDIHWPQGDVTRAAEDYEQARNDAEQRGIAGERATAQAHRALALAFADPTTADSEITLAHHLLTDLTLHATTLTVHIAGLIRDAGHSTHTGERAQALRAEIETAGLTSLLPLLELAICFHHAVRADGELLAAAIQRLRRLTHDGDHAYLADIACFMGNRPITPDASPVRWLESEETIRRRWRTLVTERCSTY
ncbi:ATP/GTP-binding protein [Streptomyces sp. W16]|uniref:ATP/GTP-binding protein n=1 Tax=Streptomyces sp. W16 TaxID=3076631 RepID=UPI00295A7D3C|nr:ATP/GTP-binding protein [Streptomyces sp. W16]MDV9169016.1 ATP/GTP-binding protein [Streptomyces sp. W16]